MNWISVKDELPPLSKEVFVLIDRYEYDTYEDEVSGNKRFTKRNQPFVDMIMPILVEGSYVNDFILNVNTYSIVTHWMNIPTLD